MLPIALYFIDFKEIWEDYDLVKERLAQAHAEDDTDALQLYNNLHKKLEDESQSST